MRYKLYLDDLRYPDYHEDWRIARNYHDALWYVKTYGLPYHISFDHDLGVTYGPSSTYTFSDGMQMATADIVPKEFTGYDFAKWFCDHVLVNGLDLPDDFSYNVHSANPVGAENIRSFMDSFLKDGYVV